jgi:Tol biopolymer transport system component
MRRLGLLALLLSLLAADAGGASRYLPRLRFRVLVTPHFRIYYHQGGEALARELAAIAEEVRRELPARLNLPPPGVTHVVLADQDDASNGSAIPIPYNTIMLTAAWPAQSELIGFTRDWLRLVFVHEYAHILHTDRSRGWASVMRGLFGRSPVAFPNLALPLWQIEGFATWLESSDTGEGRVRAGDAATIVRERVRAAGPEPIDRYNGGLVDWPGGHGPYLYGGFFHDYLVRRFGARKLGELIERQAGRVHYFGAGAYEAVFGASLRDLWRSFMDSVEPASVPTAAASVAATSPPSVPARLTRHGFFVASPRFSPDGTSLFYTLQTPHRFPSIARIAAGGPIGSNTGVPDRVTPQFGAEGLTVASDLVIFDQLELDTNVALRADLYVVPTAGGRPRRLTKDERVLQPALSPDGRSLAAVRLTGGGARRLAWFDVERAAGRIRLKERPGPGGGGQAGSPRWAPDGRQVAFERRLPGGASEIALVDPVTSDLHVLASSTTHRLVAPAWTPDGLALVFASDQPVVPGSDPLARSFQLYVVPAAGGSVRRLTAVPGGATAPVISPDGRRVVFVGYTENGADLFELPFDPGAAVETGWPAPPPVILPAESPRPAAVAPPLPDVDRRSYSPLHTLLPRAWVPVADTGDDTLRLGVATGGVDVLGRHAWGTMLRWRAGWQHEAVQGTHRGRPDVDVAYTYDRWRTPFFVSASDETSFLTVRTGAGDRRPDAELREQNVSAGLLLPIARVRHVQLWQAAFNYERRTLQVTSADAPRTFLRHAIEAGWQASSARRFGYSISQEEGGSIGIGTEQVRRAFGADGNAQAWTLQARGFRRLGGGHAVLAARAAAAFSSGDRTVRRVFFLGGAAPSGPVVNLGSEAIEMLRGVEEEAYLGTRVVSGGVEYRLPIARIDRGWRTAPLFLRAVHAALFADAGHAWDSGFAWADFKTSVGAEVSMDAVIGFGLPLTVTGGVAWARDGAAGRRLDARPYLRIGKSF